MNAHRDSDAQLPDLSGLIFKAVRSEHDLTAILECRWKGYKRYGFANPSACRDFYDTHAVQYVCEDEETKRTLGCLRMLVSHHRPFELEEYFDISGWANNGTRPAELTRFSVPAGKRISAIKFGLWKLAWLDATTKGHTHFIIWTTAQKMRMYEALGFVPYPQNSSAGFVHPKLANMPHVVMVFDLVTAPELYRRTRPSMYQFFCEQTHPNIFSSVESS